MEDVKLAPRPEKKGRLEKEKQLLTQSWRQNISCVNKRQKSFRCESVTSGHLERRDFSCHLIKGDLKICRKDIPILIFMRNRILFAWISSWSWKWCYKPPWSHSQLAVGPILLMPLVISRLEIMEQKLLLYILTRLFKIKPTLLWPCIYQFWIIWAATNALT